MRDRNRRGAHVGDALPDGEEVAVVDRDDQFEALAGRAGPRQRHRLARGKRRRACRPDRVGIGRRDALAGPAEAGEIGALGTGRGEQADGGQILGHALALADEHEIVEASTLQIDRTGEAAGSDAHARAFAKHDVARRGSPGGHRRRDRRSAGAGGWRGRLRRGRSAARRSGKISPTAGSSRSGPTRSARSRAACCDYLSPIWSLISKSHGTGSCPWPPHG